MPGSGRFATWPSCVALTAALAFPAALAQVPPPGPPPEAQTPRAVPYRAVRASQLHVLQVLDREGRVVGGVEDMVVHLGHGRVRFAMLRIDPGLLREEHLFAVPMERLRLRGQRDGFVLDAGMEQVARAGIDRAAWARDGFSDLEHIRRMDEAWGIRNSDTAPVARARALVGREIRSRDGTAIGKVEDLVIDAGRGQVHYVIAAFAGPWLGSSRRIALPLRAFYRHPAGDALTLNTDPSRVADMPAFEPRDYEGLENEATLAHVNRALEAFPR